MMSQDHVQQGCPGTPVPSSKRCLSSDQWVLSLTMVLDAVKARPLLNKRNESTKNGWVSSQWNRTGLLPLQEWVAGDSRKLQCKLWFWHLTHSGFKMSFKAAGEEEAVWVSEQKEAEHLWRWHYTEQSAKSGPLTDESWDCGEFTNFSEFPASGNS